MQWLRRITLIFAVGISVSVFALVIRTFWSASKVDAPVVAQHVQDLQILVIILLGLAGLYTVVFLLSPNMSERILKEQADVTVKNVKAQVSVAVGDLRELREEIREIMRHPNQPTRGIRTELPAAAPQHGPVGPQHGPAASAHPASELSGRDVVQLSGRLRVLNSELVQIYQRLAALCGPSEHEKARDYLNQALALSPDPSTASELHYALACLLAKEGDLDEAVIQLQTAFRNNSRELEHKLAKDTEEGGPLYALTTTPPHDRVLDDLLMNISIGV